MLLGKVYLAITVLLLLWRGQLKSADQSPVPLALLSVILPAKHYRCMQHCSRATGDSDLLHCLRMNMEPNAGRRFLSLAGTLCQMGWRTV